jgi:hypothetical protein
MATKAASREGVAVINLFEELPVEGTPPDSWYFPRDGPLNRAGHQRVAAVLAKAISRQ